MISAGSFLDGGPSHPIQRAALPLVERSIADQEAKAIQRLFREKRDLMTSRLTAMGMKLHAIPTGAFYVFADVSGLPGGLGDGMQLFREALERKVIVVPGEFFDVNPGRRRRNESSLLRGFVRFSYGPPIETLSLGLDRLEELINERS